ALPRHLRSRNPSNKSWRQRQQAAAATAYAQSILLSTCFITASFESVYNRVKQIQRQTHHPADPRRLAQKTVKPFQSKFDKNLRCAACISRKYIQRTAKPCH